MIEVLQHTLGIVLVVFMARIVWESSIVLHERKQRYLNGTHDYYDNPIDKD